MRRHEYFTGCQSNSPSQAVYSDTAASKRGWDTVPVLCSFSCVFCFISLPLSSICNIFSSWTIHKSLTQKAFCNKTPNHTPYSRSSQHLITVKSPADQQTQVCDCISMTKVKTTMNKKNPQHLKSFYAFLASTASNASSDSVTVWVDIRMTVLGNTVCFQSLVMKHIFSLPQVLQSTRGHPWSQCETGERHLRSTCWQALESALPSSWEWGYHGDSQQKRLRSDQKTRHCLASYHYHFARSPGSSPDLSVCPRATQQALGTGLLSAWNKFTFRCSTSVSWDMSENILIFITFYKIPQRFVFSVLQVLSIPDISQLVLFLLAASLSY